MTMWGADAPELQTLAQRLDEAAKTLDTIGVTLRSQLMTSPWHGPDSTTFRHDWDSSHHRSITSAAQYLRDGGRRLRTNATEQVHASRSISGQLAPVGGVRIVAGDKTATLPSDPRQLAADTMRNLAGNRQFEITAVQGHPPTLLVRLPGVEDLTSSAQAGERSAEGGALAGSVAGPFGAVAGAAGGFIGGFVGEAARSDGNARDLSSAFWQDLWHKGDYANVVTNAVSDYRLTHGITETPNIVLVGHSYGAMTAMDLAADHNFNGVVGHVTYVIAAGGGQSGRINDIPAGTKVMVMTNTKDKVSASIHLTNEGSVPNAPGRFEDRFTSTGNYPNDFGHNQGRYADQLQVESGQAKDFVTDAFQPFVGQNAVTTSLSTVVSQ